MVLGARFSASEAGWGARVGEGLGREQPLRLCGRIVWGVSGRGAFVVECH